MKVPIEVCDEHASDHLMTVNAYARLMNANRAISIDQEHNDKERREIRLRMRSCVNICSACERC